MSPSYWVAVISFALFTRFQPNLDARKSAACERPRKYSRLAVQSVATIKFSITEQNLEQYREYMRDLIWFLDICRAR
jgi:hypothetical protein